MNALRPLCSRDSTGEVGRRGYLHIGKVESECSVCVISPRWRRITKIGHNIMSMAVWFPSHEGTWRSLAVVDKFPLTCGRSKKGSSSCAVFCERFISADGPAGHSASFPIGDSILITVTFTPGVEGWKIYKGQYEYFVLTPVTETSSQNCSKAVL